MRRRRTTSGFRAGATILATLTLVAAGCGGGGGTSGDTEWASGFCSAVTTWRNEVAETTFALTSGPSRESLQAAAEDVRAATDAFVSTVGELGAPEIESGEEARTAVESFAGELEAGATEIQNAVQGEEIFAAVSEVRSVAAELTTALTTMLDDLQRLGDADDELEQSFLGADECEGLIPPTQ